MSNRPAQNTGGPPYEIVAIASSSLGRSGRRPHPLDRMWRCRAGRRDGCRPLVQSTGCEPVRPRLRRNLDGYRHSLPHGLVHGRCLLDHHWRDRNAALQPAAAICFVGDPDNQAAGTLYIVEPDRGGAPYYTIIRSFTLSGAHLNTWDVSDIIGRATGITFDGTHFWLIGYADLVQCDTDFNLVQDHIVPWAVGDGGLDFDAPTNMLYNLSRGFQSLVVFERGAEFITHQQYIGGYGLTSLAIGHITRESRNLWLLDNSNIPSVIMEINDDYYDPVETATWGSIKALYR